MAPSAAFSGAKSGPGPTNRAASVSLGMGGAGSAGGEGGAGSAGGTGVGGSLPAQEASGVPIEEVAGPSNGSGTIPGDGGQTQQNGDAAPPGGSKTIPSGVDSTHRNDATPGNIVEPNQSSGDTNKGDTGNIGSVPHGNLPVKQVPEPSSLLLVAIGILGFRATRNRMNQRQR